MTSLSKADELQQRIDVERRKIHADGYAMSIGELVNMYRDEELVIHPAYQRLFRWSQWQRSRLIDSLLLGIPVPSVFVSQRRSGKWEVIDGLQRISTILQLFGVLKNSEGELVEPLVLKGTDSIPELEGMRWSDPSGECQLSTSQRLAIKRAKLEVRIILKESDAQGKYEIFQRLNTGGSTLVDQEIRNCLLVMINPEFATWFTKLVDSEDFQGTLKLSRRSRETAFDGELASRFFVLSRMSQADIEKISEFGPLITERLTKMAADPNFDMAAAEKHFLTTFSYIRAGAGQDAFRRYNPQQGTYSDRLLIPSFEAIAIGIGQQLHQGRSLKPASGYTSYVKALWEDADFRENQGAGVPPRTRMPVAIQSGARYFF